MFTISFLIVSHVPDVNDIKSYASSILCTFSTKIWIETTYINNNFTNYFLLIKLSIN